MLESALFSWNRSVWCWFSIAENFGFALSFLFFTWQSLYLYRFLTPLPLSDESAELGIDFESNCNLEKERTGGLDEGGEREKSEDWKEEVGENNQCQMRRLSVVLLWRRFETSASCRAPFRVPLQHVMPSPPISPPPSVSMPSPIPRPCAPHDISPKHPMEDESWWDFRPQASPDDDQGGFTRRTGISCQLIYENSMVWPNHCIVWHGTYGITPTHVPKASTAFTHHCH